MVVDCPVGVVVKVFVPHKVYYHVIGEYPLGIHNEQGEDVKLFHCQYDLGFTDIYNPVPDRNTNLQLEFLSTWHQN